jgi:hypothetical protein
MLLVSEAVNLRVKGTFGAHTETVLDVLQVTAARFAREKQRIVDTWKRRPNGVDCHKY